MNHSLSKYVRIPRPGRSLGFAELEIPFQRLVEQFLRLFLLVSLKAVWKGRRLPSIDTILSESGLDPDIIRTDRLLEAYAPASLKWNGTLDDLERLCGEGRDLCEANGAWTASRDMLNSVVDSITESLTEQFAKIRDRLCREVGLRGAEQFLDELRSRLEAVRSRPVLARTMSQHGDCEQLEKELPRVEAIPRSLGMIPRVLSSVRRTTPVRRWLKPHQENAVRKFLQVATRLKRSRFDMLAADAVSRLLDSLLGTVDTRGRLLQLENDLKKTKERFEELKAILSPITRQTPQPGRIEVVQSVNSFLDDSSLRRVSDCFFELAARAGCRPEILAAELLKRPLRLGEQLVAPHEWSRVEPRLLETALLRRVSRYLGVGSDVELHPQEPRTAADFLATFDLTHDAVRTQVNRCLPELLERSRPYSGGESVFGVQQNRQVFLYCFADHRSEWVRRLQVLSVVAEAENVEAYHVAHPFRLLILQYEVAIPIGALASFHRWSATAADNETKDAVKPHIDRHQLTETRFLTLRVRTLEDATQMLNAAKAAKIVVPVGTRGSLTLAHRDPRLAELFAPSKWRPAEVTAETMQALVQQDVRCTDFLCRVFSEQPELRHLLDRLLTEESSLRLVQALSAAQVLEERAGRWTLKTHFDDRPHDAPRQLIERYPGELLGLSEESLRTLLLSNDLLYSVVFFAIQDAWLSGRLNRQAVPDSIIRYVGETGT